MDLARQIYRLLKEQNLTLCVAESATGGFISHLLTEISGISEVYMGGVCAYANEAKKALLGVSEATLQKHGAVSEQTALQMASGACCLFKTDVALCDTGIAGPAGGSKEKPVGLFYLSVCLKGQLTVSRQLFKGDRSVCKSEAAHAALLFLYQTLENRKAGI